MADKADHELKTWPYYFDQVWCGSKRFEWRRDDRPFRIGDLVALREWTLPGGYSGRVLLARITCVVGREKPPLCLGIPSGWVILGIDIIGHSFGELVPPLGEATNG